MKKESYEAWLVMMCSQFNCLHPHPPHPPPPPPPHRVNGSTDSKWYKTSAKNMRENPKLIKERRYQTDTGMKMAR